MLQQGYLPLIYPEEKTMNNLLSLYGLKFNPFTPEVPTEALHVHPRLENFCWRIEHSLIREGGFALISGDPGAGKSVALRILSERLSRIRDAQVGVITHPSTSLIDFYRELGDIYGIPLHAHNRWNSFKNLRERWINHLESTLVRPILFVDEAQEVPVCVLNELRLLTSMQFDSRILLSVILAGDQRLNDKLRKDELIPLGSRIRLRLNLEYASTEQLLQGLKHLVTIAGNPTLMNPVLMQTICEHAMGNYRALSTMSYELLSLAAQQEKVQLDEKLYFECFPTPTPTRKRK
jgi:type II secretory pathway predicted ATPase ExeA